MPIIDAQDARDLGSHLQRFFDSKLAERPHRLRLLFTEEFDFNAATGKVSLAEAPKNVILPSDADRIASTEGINVVYVPLEIPGTTRVRKAEAAAAARLIAGQLGDDMLLLISNQQTDGEASQLHVILPTFAGSTPALRRMVIERDLPRRTVLQQLSNIYHQWREIKDLRLALEKAFDVEAVTKDFFKDYSKIFGRVQGLVKGFQETDEGHEAKKLFVQTLFNRLMFIYFLSRKGWLRFKGNPDYLAALWKDYRKGKDAENFYVERLKLLFFTGLNNPRSANLLKDNPVLHALIGDVPFLNGGLFAEEEHDKRSDITIPDEAFSAILHELFEHYNFTVMESTPLDQEVAVDPEMLGKVFEELVTGRHETGSYYTPRPVVSFMCREALKGYLREAVVSLPMEAIERFVDQHDVSGLNLASAEAVQKALTKIKIVDPACGSGAYLLGMMHELVDLETALYSEKLLMDTKSLYDLKLRIIEENVYGVDIDQFAVNIAMLRLWLSLAIDYESFPPPPLPNLDFKIVCGDSLTAPDPSPNNYGTLFRHRVHDIANQLADLKGRYIKATSQEKANLTKDIDSLRSELRKALLDEAAPEEAADWRVEFAEVFDQNGGFDVVVANPPYVRIQALNAAYATNLRSQFSSARGKFDLYVPFAQRSIQLMSNSGHSVLIMPNKYLVTAYGRQLLALIEENGLWQGLVDFGDLQVFSTATNYTCISIFAKHPQEPVVKTRKNPGDNVQSVIDRYFLGHHNIDQRTISAPSVQELAADLSTGRGSQLGNVVRAIFQGIISGGDTILYLRDDSSVVADILAAGEDVILPALLKGTDIDRYLPPTVHLRVIYPYAFELGRTRLLREQELEKKFPTTYAYLLRHRARLGSRGSDRMNYPAWYALWCPRDMDKLQAPKILTQVLARRPSFTFDRRGDFYFTGGGNAGVYGIILNQSFGVSEEHYLAVLALLNSFAMKLWAISRGTDFQGGYMSFGKRYIEEFPIPAMDGSWRARLAAMAEASLSGQTVGEQTDALVADLYSVNLKVSMDALGAYE
ncbi:hypothetical protein ES703_40542 [subsurface metagenome]